MIARMAYGRTARQRLSIVRCGGMPIWRRSPPADLEMGCTSAPLDRDEVAIEAA
jgi:hypothetical protein